MIKTISISLGLVGLTAFGGMALSMAHDLRFASPQRVAPEQLQQVALSQPAISGDVAAIGVATGETQVIRAIVESSGPHNRLAGKSAATASSQAPVSSIAPVTRAAFQDEYDRDIIDTPRSNRTPRDVVVTVSAPSFARSAPVSYISTTPAPVRSAVPSAVSRNAATPEPDYLIGVFR